MSEQSSPSSRKKGIFSRIFSRISMIIATLVLSLLLSILLEWIGIAFWWSEQGHLHSQNMMLTEMQWLSNDFTQSIFTRSSTDLATNIIANMHYWIFVKTGIQDWLANPGSTSVERWIYHYGRAYIESIIYVSIVFVIRLIIIAFTSPLFLFAGVAGVTEGLMMRDIRKFGAGRESAFIYHHARRYVMPLMITSWVVYLSLPFSIHPNTILVPSALLFGLMICITSATFKKFL
ncbi:integrating conjugative element membrane protein (TIGR03747 family) [Bisgaardia hudsonensis]|uniref:Integrating conjugative element membrane protein (TIGR03747 family) n=1 Tax=Bisgaardia hudsonensis TaxID=109472 RepID=A0A4R2N376_9PAST|nr:TIGR03747 family integrating conjugative element membrane protein [Bisgaardia hudsonensis]QLB13900.1 integrating conjugative element membrane protein [Bisgaardia hudsonensis]TCP14331.1 integrating conjugative element membrane protein (TIGR03747 family) [Bisgaardia hudsonensis]